MINIEYFDNKARKNGGLLWHEINIILTEFRAANAKLAKYEIALEYYAHSDHYTEDSGLAGYQKPGVLVDRGCLAKEALRKFPETEGEWGSVN